MELWDAYDKNFNRIEGVTLTRGEKINDELITERMQLFLDDLKG